MIKKVMVHSNPPKLHIKRKIIEIIISDTGSMEKQKTKTTRLKLFQQESNPCLSSWEILEKKLSFLCSLFLWKNYFPVLKNDLFSAINCNWQAFNVHLEKHNILMSFYTTVLYLLFRGNWFGISKCLCPW